MSFVVVADVFFSSYFPSLWRYIDRNIFYSDCLIYTESFFFQLVGEGLWCNKCAHKLLQLERFIGKIVVDDLCFAEIIVQLSKNIMTNTNNPDLKFRVRILNSTMTYFHHKSSLITQPENRITSP